MKEPESFIVEIIDTQNHNWQGRIFWVRKKRYESFRSARELMHLIGSVVSPEELLSDEEYQKAFEE